MKKTMSDEELIKFIAKRRNDPVKARRKWEAITKELADMGHVSARTGKPLSESQVRHLVVYGTASYRLPGTVVRYPAVGTAQPGANPLEQKLVLLRSILKLQASSDDKLKLIEVTLAE